MSSIAKPLKWPPVLPLDKDLELLLPFNERGGAKIYDRSGKKRHGDIYGTIGSSSWAVKHRSSAFNFDGSTNYILFGDLGAFPSKGTLCYWVNMTPENYRNHFCTELGSASGLRAQVYTGGQFIVVVETASHVVMGSAFPSGSDVFVAITWDQVAGEISCYVNNVLKLDGGAISAWPSTMPAFQLGRGYEDNAARYMKGLIWGLSLHGRILSANELTRKYYRELRLVRY